LVRARA